MEFYVKSEFAVVLVITENHLFEAANVILQLNKFLNVDFDIHIFIDNANNAYLKYLSKITKNTCVIHQFDLEFLSQRMSLDVSRHKELKDFVNRFSVMVFARYEAINLLKNYKAILMLDSDILIKQDISPILTNMNLGGGYTVKYGGWNIDETINVLNQKSSYLDLTNGRKVSRWCTCANVIALSSISNDRIDSCVKALYEMTKFLVAETDINSFYEERVISCVLPVFFNLEPLDAQKFNCYPNQINIDQAIIIHFGTFFRKIWRNKIYSSIFREWIDNNNYWKSLILKYEDKDVVPSGVFYSNQFDKNLYPTIPDISSLYGLQLALRMPDVWNHIIPKLFLLDFFKHFTLVKINFYTGVMQLVWIDRKPVDDRLRLYIIIPSKMEELSKLTITIEVNVYSSTLKNGYELFSQLKIKNCKSEIIETDRDSKIRFYVPYTVFDLVSAQILNNIRYSDFYNSVSKLLNLSSQ